MHLAIKLAVTLVVGIALGLGATWYAVDRNVPGAVNDGPWQTNLLIASPSSDPYTRAAVALHGLFALNRSEVIYYLATSDSQGASLNGACRYEIDGRDPDARWWSITAYGENEYLIPNPTNRYSVDKTSVWRTSSGRLSIAVGSRPQPSNWIPVTGNAFSLVLRLFNPDPGISLAPEHASLPAIKRIGCL
jgi:hypothetical protein